jgi:site-specific recombinase XerD
MMPIHAPKAPDTVPVYLKPDEVKRLISLPEKYSRNNKLRDKCILETFVFTGIRRNELLSLDWDDIDFKSDTLKVRKGKGKKQRIIPITDPLSSDLWDYLQSRLPLKDRAMFTSFYGTRLTATPLSQTFRRYLKIAGLDQKGITLHKLRHTFATLLIQQGVDLMSIKELLGHEDLNSTKIYTHVDTSHLRKQVEKINLSIYQK